MDILDAIGNTSLARLRRVVPEGCAEVLAKLEWENPTGSMKDRMAHAVIARAASTMSRISFFVVRPSSLGTSSSSAPSAAIWSRFPRLNASELTIRIR